jgi:hypothetical protein
MGIYVAEVSGSTSDGGGGTGWMGIDNGVGC